MSDSLPTLLLVDDEDGIRLVMSVLLKDMGYAVSTAARGDEALALYAEGRHDIVVSDIKMPGKDGIALLREIKALNPDAEVLLLTGHGDMDLAVAGLRYGAGDFLNKPVSDAALEVALERAGKRIALREALRRHTEELEELVTQRTAELVRSERFAAVGESAAALAHAIKNIAGALEGTMYVLEKGLELNKREYFEQGWQMIRSDVSRLRTLAVGLLDLGRPPVLDWRPTPPAEPAMQVYESLRSRAHNEGVMLEWSNEAGDAPFAMPPEDVYQCLLNLAVNALEACAEKRVPAMDAGTAAAPPRVRITVRRENTDGDSILYSVEDNGPGMGRFAPAKHTEETQGPGVPETDRQGARTLPAPGEAFASGKAGGSGIGLFTTRRTAREMGAELSFTSPESGGTLAVLRLRARD